MRAYDIRYPERPTQMTVMVSVQRNLNAPRFSATSYEFPIDEMVSPYTSIGQVFASDADVLVNIIILVWRYFSVSILLTIFGTIPSTKIIFSMYW